MGCTELEHIPPHQSVMNIYQETMSLLSIGLIQGSPPFYPPTQHAGRAFHLLGLELERWGLSLPILAGN